MESTRKRFAAAPAVAVLLLGSPGVALADESGKMVAWGSRVVGVDLAGGFVAACGGQGHSLGLQADGSIVAWGFDFDGECNVPPPAGDFLAVSAGGTHALGLKKDGSIVAWGSNANDRCNVPAPNTGFQAVAAGGSHSLGLKDGKVVAWGDNRYGQCNVPAENSDFQAVAAGGWNSLGLKKDGTIVVWGFNVDGECDVPPPNADFVAVAAGWLHFLGLKKDGSIVAWGVGAKGQCDVPPPNADFVAIAAGHDHSLGLKRDHSIVAWGADADGQCDVPPPNMDFQAVGAGHYHSLGVKMDGSIVAWGSNGYGQLDVPPPNGDFVALDTGNYFTLALRKDGTIVAWGTDVNGQCDVPPDADFQAVAAGGYHGLGLKTGGAIVAWGSDDWGQCDVPPDAGFQAVAADGYHSLGLKDGVIVAWGSDANGQCDVPPPNEDFVAMDTGYYHSLGLKKDGRIVAWGLNANGQCDAPPGTDFQAVSAGGYHSLGLTTDGRIIAWGLNADGQCDVPPPNADFQAVAAGGYHSLGLKKDGSIVAWGRNSHGQCTVPSPNAGFVAIAGDIDYSVALRGTGGPEAPVDLTLGTPKTITFERDRPPRFRLSLPAERTGKPLLITLTDLDPADRNSLYARWGSLPTATQYDLAARRGSPGQVLEVLEARPADLFLLVEGTGFGGTPNEVTVLAEAVDLALTGISAGSTGNGGNGRVELSALGAGFRECAVFALVKGDTRIPAAETTIVAPDRAELVFDLVHAPLGTYDVTVACGAFTAPPLAGAFTVGVAERGSEIRSSVVAAARFRVRWPSRIVLRYENGGDAEAAAPLFEVRGSPKVHFRPSEDADYGGNEIQVLGIHPDGVAGSLPPGATGEIPIFLAYQPADAAECSDEPCGVELRIRRLEPLPGEAVGWDALARPPGVSEDSWKATWPALASAMGGSWAEYRDSLGRIATRLSHRGTDAASVRDLFRFAFREAAGRPSAAIVGLVRVGDSLEPVRGRTVAALAGGRAAGCATTDGDGAFAIERLEEGRSYELAAEGCRVISVSGGPSAVTVPPRGGGDLLAQEVLVALDPAAHLPDCPAVDDGGLPEEALSPPDALFVLGGTTAVRFVSAWDPNDKEGPGGDDADVDLQSGIERIRADRDVLFTIHIANTSRTAGPGSVTIRDVLSPLLDLDTLTMREVRVGSPRYPSQFLSLDRLGFGYMRRSGGEGDHGLSSYRMAVNLELPEDQGMVRQTVDVDIRPTIDYDTREVKWEFGMVGDAGIYGFLPPDDDLQQGEAHVSFSVRPVPGLAYGTEITNEAEVEFDAVGQPDTNVARLRIRILEDPCCASPADGARGIDPAAALRWGGRGASSGRIYLWRDGEVRPAAPTAEVAIHPDDSVNEFVPAQPFLPGASYRWQVEAIWETEIRPGPEWGFTTREAAPPPGDFAYVDPADGAEVALRDLAFAWQPAARADSYDLHIRPVGNGAPVDIPGLLGTKFEEARALGLEKGARYQWQVKARNSGGETAGPTRTFTLAKVPIFSRGDVDGNGGLELTDAIYLLSYQFLGGDPPPCLAAGDADANASIELTDAIYLLSYQFLGGPSPPLPYPACGDGNEDDEALGCRESPGYCP